MTAINHATKLIFGTRPAPSNVVGSSQVEGVFVDRLMHEGVPGWKPAWHPLNMSVRPWLEINHFNAGWLYPDLPYGHVTPSSGTDTTLIYQGGNTGRGVTIGGRKCFYITDTTYVSPAPSVWPAGGSLSTFAFANSTSGVSHPDGMWSNDYYAVVLPPAAGTHSLQIGSGVMWKDPANGTGAWSNGPNGAPKFTGSYTDVMHNGWGSQYWEIGPANFYRRDGLDKTSTILNSLTGPYPGYTVSGNMGSYLAVAKVQDALLYGGYFAFLAIWRGTPPPHSEIEKLEGWCHWQFGYANLLPDAHPYKNAPPQA